MGHSGQKLPHFFHKYFGGNFSKTVILQGVVHDFTAFLIGRPFGVHFIVQIYKENKIYLVDENYSKNCGNIPVPS